MGVMVKDDLCKMVVEVRRVGDRVMAVVLFFEENVLILICWYAVQSGRSLDEKQSL